jgi:hypothetical protein
MSSQFEHSQAQHDHVDATGLEHAVDQMERRVLGAPKDHVRHEDDDPEAPAVEQDLDGPTPERGPAAEPSA